ncbi:hypothetical protein FB567DRAFT_349147 [Paraphoma chrysanthemicola]|uniref:Heterokaryon incompatibility domain-containing protein n=1 Tax=Paraphoma chrysanthemicola TaxID=798071 RepID=A0A8K0VY93_9PLEO|nr:hypothetical protein FB567DRAFT_349147 [Paraphoma chrysanthemicola]
MYLLWQADDGSISLVQFNGREVPKYAILSHTWDEIENEVTFLDVESANGTFLRRTTEDGQTYHIQVAGGKSEDMDHQKRLSTLQSKKGYEKIRFCCQQASKHDLAYFWIDSCCINRTNSAELAEAINSMFRWYRNAAICYVYLTDVHAPERIRNGELITGQVQEAFRKSKWFTRGWTLQELIAPVTVEFYSQNQVLLGERNKLSPIISDITSLPTKALQGAPLSHFTVEERMSWSDNRSTTLEEDTSYCLFGIFDVYMPPIYGEGNENARKRLRNEIRNVEDRTERELSASFSFLEFDSRPTTIRAAHNKPCEWLLSTSAFRKWACPISTGANPSILWIKGQSGTGKSTIMKYLHQYFIRGKGSMRADSLYESATGEGSDQGCSIKSRSYMTRSFSREGLSRTTVITFLFNSRGTEFERSTQGMYRALLVQLMGVRSYMAEVHRLLALSNTKIGGSHNWSIETLQYLLKETILRVRDPVICLIDTLDECEEQQVRDMIYFLGRVGELAMSANISFKVCFASRHYPLVSIDKGIELTLEGQEGHNADITKYLETELRIGNNETSKQIRQEVQHKSSSIFMWVVIVVGILNKAYDSGRVHALRRVLRELPSDLNDLFHNILTLDSRNQLELLLCIDWIFSASRALNPMELYFAILAGAEPNAESYWDPDVEYRNICRHFILDSSRGLAHIPLSNRPTVQFIHESVREFLLNRGGLTLIETSIGQELQLKRPERLLCCCLRHLSVGMFASSKEYPNNYSGPWDAQERFKICHLENFPFLEYALYHVWTYGSIGKHVLAKTYRSLQDVADIRTIEFDKVPSIMSGRQDQHVEVSYVIARFSDYAAVYFICIIAGNQEFVRIVVNGHWHLNIRVDDTPTDYFGSDLRYLQTRDVLCYMAELGNEKVFGALLRTGFFDVDKKDEDGRTPMSEAVRCEQGAIVRLLQEAGVNINKSSDRIVDFFQQACMNNEEKKIRALLGYGLDINISGGHYGNALQAAVARSCVPIVKFLLQNGADVNMKGGVYGNALYASTVIQNQEISKILLDHGADVTAREGRHDLALKAAVEQHHTRLIERLRTRISARHGEPEEQGPSSQ